MKTFIVKYYTYKMLWPHTSSCRDKEINSFWNRWPSHTVTVYMCLHDFTVQLSHYGNRLHWLYLILVDYNKTASTQWYIRLEFQDFQFISREDADLFVINTVGQSAHLVYLSSSREAAGSQGGLLQVLLAATLDVSVCALTWLLCRQSQLWIQVWTVVGVYSAFVFLSAATNPVQTNTCEQKNKKHEQDTVSEYNHANKAPSGVRCVSIMRYLW